MQPGGLGAELDPGPTDRMVEGQPDGMQTQPAREATAAGVAVEGIPQQRMTQPGQVHTQLVGAARAGS